jgi:PadR family transcriptional regulator, regulatory protein PadR
MPSDDRAPWPLPRNFLRPCILLLLREEPAHGYDLLQRLRPLGFVRDDPGGLYRALRALEQEGLVLSSWDESGSGPDRRVYRVTGGGLEELHRSARNLANVREALDAFLDRTGEAGRTHR